MSDHHACPWPGCDKTVPARMWGCGIHWSRLPLALREALWCQYRPGQEGDGVFSDGYVRAARAIDEWIAIRVAEMEAEDARYAPQIKMVLEREEAAKRRRSEYRYRRRR